MTMTRVYLSSYVYRKSLGHSLEALLYKGKLWKPCEVRARLYKQGFSCQVPGGGGVGSTPVVPALGRLGKEEQAFKVILYHTASSA